MRKKAQIQMGESIMIIIVLLILLAFALVFFGRVKESSIIEKQIVFEEIDIVTLSQVTYFLPELQCSFDEDPLYGCIDEIKFIYLANLINDSFKGKDDLNQDVTRDTYDYYRELFGAGKITLFLPNRLPENLNITMYEVPGDWDSKAALFMPVVVYDPIREFNDFGVLKIEKYS